MNKRALARCMVIVLAVFLLFYAFVRLTPMYADDYTYLYSFKDGFESEARNERITDVKSLIDSQIGHYFYMNGRVVAHTLAQAFLALDRGIFHIAASLAFVALGVLICYHSTGDVRKIEPLYLILSYSALFLLAPSFGQSYLWLTGACNYLFTFVVMLLFLVPYRRCYLVDRKAPPFVSLCSGIGMLAAGILAGNTNENTGVSLVVMLAVYLIAYFFRHRRIRLWMLAGFVGAVIGCAGGILAPGNTVKNGGAFVRFSIGGIVKYTIFYTARMIQNFAPLLVILAVMLAYILVRSRGEGKSYKQILMLALEKHFFLLFYFVFFLGSVYAMVIPAQFPERAWAHSLALLVIVTLMTFIWFLQVVRLNGVRNRRLRFAVSMIAVLVCTTVYLSAYPTLNAVSVTYHQRVQQIEQAKQAGETQVSVCSIVSTSAYVCFDFQGDISEDPDYWINQGMAKYHGIQTITKDFDCLV